MKKRNKVLALIMCGFMLASAAGCAKGSKTVSEEDNVTLKVLLTGSEAMKDSQEVWSLFNEKLPAYIPNTQAEFEVIQSANFAEKWKLIAASKEQVDVLWFGYMLKLYDEVSRGSIQSLDDLYQYVPDLTNEVPEWVLNLGKMNGKSYVVPIEQLMVNLPLGAVTPRELAEKYNLDAEGITKTFNKKEMVTRDDFKIFEDYLEKLKQNGELGKGVAKSFINQLASKIGGLGQYKENLVGSACIDWSSDDLTVYDRLTDFPASNEYYAMIYDWYKKGYIREDILTLTDATADEGKQDGYVLWSKSQFKDNSERLSKTYGMEVLSIPMYQELLVGYTTPTTNLAIPKTSVSPERAMRFIELMNTQKGKEMYNLLVYGIEGKHYKKIDDNTIEWLEPKAPGTSSENAYGFYNWSIGSIYNSYETQYDTPGWNEYVKNEINAKATVSPLAGFTLNTTPIQLELAQYSAIEKEYAYIEYGTTENWEELLAERNSKMKQAGSDKIVEEVRKQINEWKANNQ